MKPAINQDDDWNLNIKYGQGQFIEDQSLQVVSEKSEYEVFNRSHATSFHSQHGEDQQT